MDNEALYKFHKKMADKAFKALHKADTLEVKDAAAQSACHHTQAAWRCLDDKYKRVLGQGFLDVINSAEQDMMEAADRMRESSTAAHEAISAIERRLRSKCKTVYVVEFNDEVN